MKRETKKNIFNKTGPLLDVEDLTDANINNPTNGQALIYNNGIWENTTFVSGVSSVFGRTGAVVAQNNDYILDLLGDCEITNPQIGQSLIYDGTGWKNTSFVSGVSSVFGRTGAVTAQSGDYILDLLGDVEITGAQKYDCLQHDGLGFKNKILPIYTFKSDNIPSSYFPNMFYDMSNGGTLNIPAQTTNGLTVGVFSGPAVASIVLNNNFRTRQFTYSGPTSTIISQSTNAIIELAYINDSGLNLWTILRIQGKWQVNGSEIISNVLNIDEILNVQTTSPATNQVLAFSAGKWVNQNQLVRSVFGRTGIITAQEGDYSLTQLSDATITSPTTNQILTYNGTNWVNQTYTPPVLSVFGRTGAITAAEGDYSLTQLSDAIITSPASGQYLQYDGTQWINQNFPAIPADLGTQTIQTNPFGLNNTGASLIEFFSLTVNTTGTVSNPGPDFAVDVYLFGSQEASFMKYYKILGQLNETGGAWVIMRPTEESTNNGYNAQFEINITNNVLTGRVRYLSRGGGLGFFNVGYRVINRGGSQVSFSSYYNNTTGQPVPTNYYKTEKNIFLDDLSDVVITTPATNQVLTYNGTNWINQNNSNVSSVFGRTGAVVATEGDYSLNLLSDVAITSPQTYNTIQYNGTNFINQTLPTYNYVVDGTGSPTYIQNMFLMAEVSATLNVPAQSVNGVILGARVRNGAILTINLNNTFLSRENIYFPLVAIKNISDNAVIEFEYVKDTITGYDAWSVSNLQGKWIINNTVTTADVIDINEIKNVSVSSPSNKQILQYNGTNWANISPDFCIPMAEVAYNVAGGGYTLTITTQNTYYRIAPTTTLTTNNSEFLANKFDSPTAGQLRYIGAKTSLFHCAFSLSSSTANAGDRFRVQVWKNGAAFTNSIYSVDYSTNNVFATTALHIVMTLSTNDTLSLAMTDTSSNGKVITVENLNIVAMSCCAET